MSATNSAGSDVGQLRAEALAGGRAPRRFGWWYVTLHLLMSMRGYGWTLLAGALGQPIIYAAGLVLGLGALIGGPITDAHGLTVGYLMFATPALVVSTAIGALTDEFTYPVMGGFKWQRYYYGFNASPISSPQIALGVMVAGAARVLLTVTPFVLIMAAVGAVPLPGGLLLVPVAVLAGLAFGTPLLAYAASLEQDTGQFSLVQRFVVMPLFLFSGTFYPITNLPEWLQPLAWISPLWHGSELGRVVSYGSPVPLARVLAHVACLVAVATVGVVLTRRTFERRLAR